MIKVGSALMEHAEELERERGISKEVLLDSLKEAMVAAYRKYAKLNSSVGVECQLNERTGEIGIYELRTVVEELTDTEEELEITLAEARKFKPDVEIDDILEFEVTPEEFGRIAAQTAKQVIMQRIREAEKTIVMQEFEEKKGTVTTAMVQRIEGRNVVVNIGRSEAVLPPREQLPSEYYRLGNKLRVFVLDLRTSGRVPQIIVSQAHPAMVQEIFELEVPEIEDGLVDIKSIAREAGYRTKVAVTSNDPDVDAQGACIGTRGSRIQAIVNELKNEKIDIIQWHEDPIDFIVHALAPAKIVRVDILEEGKARVIVPDDQLSLAIGREGQNVRLAARLTGHKLDIKSISQMEELLEQYDPEAEEAAEAGVEGVEEAVEKTAAEELPTNVEAVEETAVELQKQEEEVAEAASEASEATEETSESPAEEAAEVLVEEPAEAAEAAAEEAPEEVKAES